MHDDTRSVVATSDSTLRQLVDRIRAAGSNGTVVDLVVPVDSSVLLTAVEFRALQEAIAAERLHVILRTADPLRLQLAERIGIRAQGLPRLAETLTAASTVPRDVPRPSTAQAVEVPSANELAPNLPQLVPPQDPELSWPQPERELQAETDAELVDTNLARRPVSEPGVSPRRWLPVAIILAGLVLATFMALRLLVPRAVITVVPKTAPVSAAIAFDVTTDGALLDREAAFALKGTPRTIQVSWEGSTPTSGKRIEPVDRAKGPIELRNAASEAVTIEAGTIVNGLDGAEFAFSEAVTVPAADSATGEPGAATGTIQAVAAGTAGNLGTGEISGRLPNGVYYSNRMEPMSGGTDREIAVVSEKDLERLQAEAREAVSTLAAELLDQEDAGQELIPSQIVVVDQQDTFDRSAGDEAAAVSMASTLTLDIVTFDGDAAADAWSEALLARLAAETPAGFAIEPEKVAFGAPIEADTDSAAIRMRVEATAQAVAVLDEAEQSALAARLVGKSPAEADVILADVPEIAEFTTRYQPGWWQPRMPQNAARIEFEMSK